MYMSLLQEPSDIDINDEQDLYEGPVEHLQVRFLSTIAMHLPETLEADAAEALLRNGHTFL